MTPRPAGDIAVSAVVMSKDEEANMADCLQSLARCAEVFVVDSGSTDRTCEIAREHGAHVVDFRWDGRYPKKKQWCLEHLEFTHDWVLYVDADERVTPELAEEIAAVVGRADVDGWFVALDYVWEGRVLRHGDRMWKLALFRRAKGRFVEWRDLDAKNMWEVEGHYQPVIEGPTARLSATLLHDDHDELFDWFARHNRYSDWEAVIRHGDIVGDGQETQTGLRGIAKRLFVRLPCKPALYFVYGFVVRAGWRDGRPGFDFAVAKAFYQWQIELKRRDLARRAGA